MWNRKTHLRNIFQYIIIKIIQKSASLKSSSWALVGQFKMFNARLSPNSYLRTICANVEQKVKLTIRYRLLLTTTPRSVLSVYFFLIFCFLFLRIMRIDSSCFGFLVSTIQVIFFLRLFPSKEEEVGAMLFEQHSDALKSIFRNLGLEKVSNLQLRPEVWKPLWFVAVQSDPCHKWPWASCPLANII